MPVESSEVIKTYFESGDRPSETQFASLIDSMVSRVLGSGVYETPAQLAAVANAVDGMVARLVGRQAGYFVFRAGDYSSQVAADPYGGLYIAPAAASSGASGAWERQVENGVYNAEWWLPDTRPSNAQVYLQTIFDSATEAQVREIIMPRRQVDVTGSLILRFGCTYQGWGESCPFDGGGATGFFPLTIAASNTRILNVSSGNVTGTAVQGEPGGFFVGDGEALYGSDGNTIENVSVIDCHAYNARTGIRFGYKSTGDAGATVVYGTRDSYCEHFRCDGIMRHGIEAMRAHGLDIVAPMIRTAEDTFSASGIKRGMRLVGCHNVTVTGGRIVGDPDSPRSGISIEEAGNGSSLGYPQDIVINGVTFEDCREAAVRVEGRASGVVVANCQAFGRRDAQEGSFIRIIGKDAYENRTRGVKVHGNQACNIAEFLTVSDYVYGLDVTDNSFVASDALLARFATLTGGTIKGRIERNTGLISGNTTTGGTFRLILDDDSDLTINDNQVTPDSNGAVFAVSGNWTFRRRNSGSNVELPSSMWDEARPELDADVYT